MTQLLAIEEAFLRAAAPQLKLTEIKAAQRAEENGHDKKFTNSLELGRLFTESCNWFFSPEGQRAAAEEGITWTKADYAEKVAGRKASDMYKLIKAASHPEEVVNDYIQQVKALRAAGNRVKRSIEELNKFAKQVQQAAAQTGGQTEGEGGQGEEGEGEETAAPQVQAAPVIVFEFSYQPVGGRKVKVKITDSQEVITNGSPEEVHIAVQFLNSIIG